MANQIELKTKRHANEKATKKLRKEKNIAHCQTFWVNHFLSFYLFEPFFLPLQGHPGQILLSECSVRPGPQLNALDNAPDGPKILLRPHMYSPSPVRIRIRSFIHWRLALANQLAMDPFLPLRQINASCGPKNQRNQYELFGFPIRYTSLMAIPKLVLFCRPR